MDEQTKCGPCSQTAVGTERPIPDEPRKSANSGESSESRGHGANESNAASHVGILNVASESKEITRITVFIHPTSANAMYRSLGKRVVISAEGREFKKNMANILTQTPHGFIRGPVKLKLAFEFMTNRKRDLDNYAKPLIDTLKGVLFVDDSDIYILNMTKRIGAAVDCIRIECEPIYDDTT